MILTESFINQTAIDYCISIDDVKRIANLSDDFIMFYDSLEEFIKYRD